MTVGVSNNCVSQIKNFQGASSFARRLLELGPKADVAMQVSAVYSVQPGFHIEGGAPWKFFPPTKASQTPTPERGFYSINIVSPSLTDTSPSLKCSACKLFYKCISPSMLFTDYVNQFVACTHFAGGISPSPLLPS